MDNVPHATCKHKLKLWRFTYTNIMCYTFISTICSPSVGQSFYNTFIFIITICSQVRLGQQQETLLTVSFFLNICTYCMLVIYQWVRHFLAIAIGLLVYGNVNWCSFWCSFLKLYPKPWSLGQMQ